LRIEEEEEKKRKEKNTPNINDKDNIGEGPNKL
jgi:hypothetical protein